MPTKTHNVELHGVEAVQNEHIYADGIMMHYGLFGDLDFREDFDVACTIALMEHLFEPEAVPNKLFETLIPGGIAHLSIVLPKISIKQFNAIYCPETIIRNFSSE